MPVLAVDGVRKSFGGVTAVNGVSFALEAGRIYGLIGPNGSGKTTLFNCITGLERRGRELLQFVKLEGLAGEYAGNLSYGQQKLVEFVRVLMTDPALILLDEPAAGVNRTLLNDLLGAVARLRDEGRTILLVEHDMKVVMGLCETVFVLDHGEKIAEGPPGLIQADERVIEAYFGR